MLYHYLLIGFLFVLVRSIRNKRPEDLLLVIWVGCYFLLTAGLQVKFMRYMLPITPILGIFGAVLLWELRRFSSFRISRLRIGDLAIAFVVGFSFLYTIAYLNIYSVDHPGTRMSAWIQENVPRGSSIAQEHWDEPFHGAHHSMTLEVLACQNGQKEWRNVGQSDSIPLVARRRFFWRN